MSEELAQDPSSLVFLPLAEALLARGELANAARVARRGADRHPQRPDAHDVLARVALQQGDPAAAERAWRSALRLAPQFGPAHRGLGFLCYEQERWYEAEEHLAAARVATPGDPAIERAWEALQVAWTEATSAPDPGPPPARASQPSAPVPVPPPEPEPRDPYAPSPRRSLEAAAQLFVDSLDGTPQVALLLDADGLVNAGHYVTRSGEDLGSVIGAHLSGVSDEATRAMRHFGLGRWTRILLESEAATVVMAPTGDGVTLVAAPRDLPLGFVRRTLEQCATVARRWLEGA
ncbi:MAG: tetratricopeptide repeat protein [Gemmatimonadaceae bacterium]|nr:tetratricopeptide repeat protein [Gemmatimonadaceae bacterium]